MQQYAHNLNLKTKNIHINYIPHEKRTTDTYMRQGPKKKLRKINIFITKVLIKYHLAASC